MGIGEVDHEQRDRAIGGQRVDLGPRHGDLASSARLFPILGEGRGRLGGIDQEGVAGGGRGREALRVHLDPRVAQAGGEGRGGADLAVGELGHGTHQMHLGEAAVTGELLEADRDEVERVSPLRLDEVETEGDRLGLLRVTGGGQSAKPGERGLRAGDQGLALYDHLLAAGAHLLGGLADPGGGGGADDALAGLRAGHALLDHAHGVAPLGKLAGPEVPGHLGIREGRWTRGGLACGDDEKGGEQG